jgi:hypothetical protein
MAFALVVVAILLYRLVIKLFFKFSRAGEPTRDLFFSFIFSHFSPGHVIELKMLFKNFAATKLAES